MSKFLEQGEGVSRDGLQAGVAIHLRDRVGSRECLDQAEIPRVGEAVPGDVVQVHDGAKVSSGEDERAEVEALSEA